MKSQASLEMVVGLIILLVVAAVVISLVLYFIKPERLPSPSGQIAIREFKSKCDSYCRDLNSVEYCRYYFGKGQTGHKDWNGNNIKGEVIRIGTYQWPTVEDRVYCFLVYPCEDRFGVGIDAIRNCKRLLCQSYFEMGADANGANEMLARDINFPSGTTWSDVIATLEAEGGVRQEEKWYERVFIHGCSGTGLPTGIMFSNCQLDKTTTPWTITCDTSCKVADAIAIGDSDGKSSIELFPSISGGKIISQPTYQNTLDMLKCPDIWTVVLSCSNPEGEKTTSLSCQ